MNNTIRDSEFFRRFMMNNKIRVELRGGNPSVTARTESAEKAFRQLGWKYSRVYFSDTVWVCGIENAEKRIAVYRNAGLDEKYISITPMKELPGHVRVRVSNRGFEEDTAQEQLVSCHCGKRRKEREDIGRSNIPGYRWKMKKAR